MILSLARLQSWMQTWMRRQARTSSSSEGVRLRVGSLAMEREKASVVTPEDATNALSLGIWRQDARAVIPSQAHAGDIGWDLTAIALIPPGERNAGAQVFFFETGLVVSPPRGYHVEVVPRSSISGGCFMLANSVGVIDGGYRGSIQVPLRYLGAPREALPAARALIGTRIAQLLVRPTPSMRIELLSAPPPPSTRGARGFGSSGAHPPNSTPLDPLPSEH